MWTGVRMREGVTGVVGMRERERDTMPVVMLNVGGGGWVLVGVNG
jgi:hypothetical protein